jgi:hypothetical protein
MKRSLALAIALATLGTASAVTDPGARCAAAKIKAAARKSNAKLRCVASATTRGVPIDQACFDKAEAKFTSAWSRIEAKGPCRTVQDENDIEFRVDAFVNTLALNLAPCGTGIDGVCGGSCPFGLNCFEIGTGCFGEPEPCRCHGSTTTCPSSTTTSTTVPVPCGSVEGVCGGACPGDPDGFSCFEIGVGCHGEPEPCRCHGSTTTCPSTSTTTTTLP